MTIYYQNNQKTIINTNKPKENTKATIKNILDEIAKGNDVKIDKAEITGEAKKLLFVVLKSLYIKWTKDIQAKQKEGIEERKKRNYIKEESLK